MSVNGVRQPRGHPRPSVAMRDDIPSREWQDLRTWHGPAPAGSFLNSAPNMATCWMRPQRTRMRMRDRIQNTESFYTFPSNIALC